MKKRTAIGILISAAFLFFAFRNSDPRLILRGLARTDPMAVALVFCVMILSIFFRALRWKILFRSIHEIGLHSLFAAASIGLMANNLLPARLGEVVRAWVIGERESISKSSAMATIVLERVLDGFTVLAFLAVMLLWRSELVPGPLRKIAWVALGICLVASSALVVIRRRRETVEKLAGRALKLLPDNAANRTGEITRAFIDGLGALHSAGDVALSFGVSFLVWLPNIVAVEIILRSFDLSLPLQASLVVFTMVTFGIMIPSAPGFVGTIQYFFVLALGLYGVAESLALSASIAYHVSVFIPLTASGLFFMARQGLSLGSMRKRAGGGVNDVLDRP